MTNVLVCVKRVPDSSGEVLLTADAQAVDARFVGFTVSPHESCAVELAVKIAEAGGGAATVLTLGPADAVEQLRSALGRRLHGGGAGRGGPGRLRPGRRGPGDRRRGVRARGGRPRPTT